MTRMDTGTLLTTKFDIVQKYNSILASEPDLTPPIAAIESLVAALTASPATTISETLDLLQTSATTLRQAVPNWIALSAGTDLFQRYLVTTLQRPGALGPGGDFGLGACPHVCFDDLGIQVAGPDAIRSVGVGLVQPRGVRSEGAVDEQITRQPAGSRLLHQRAGLGGGSHRLTPITDDLNAVVEGMKL